MLGSIYPHGNSDAAGATGVGPLAPKVYGAHMEAGGREGSSRGRQARPAALCLAAHPGRIAPMPGLCLPLILITARAPSMCLGGAGRRACMARSNSTKGVEAGEGAGREAAYITGSIWGIIAASHFLCA